VGSNSPRVGLKGQYTLQLSVEQIRGSNSPRVGLKAVRPLDCSIVRIWFQ